MRIYEFDWESARDWVFAPNIKEAREFYLRFTGCGDLDGCKIKPVLKKKWESTYLLDINEPEPDEDDEEIEDYNEEDYSCGYKIEMTFKEYAEKNTQTDFIASTEF